MAAILITGGAGQVASALASQAAAQGIAFRHVGRPEFDFDAPASIDAVFAATSPALVVNAAAYTGVDSAETDAEAAYRANRDGPARLAALCAAARVPLIHISTDYVFDGNKGAPYVESDPTAPSGVYGASKLAGEQAVQASGAPAIILRTAWVVSPTGRNFVRTMLNAARRTDQLRVVGDQRGCPTVAGDLAAAILAIAGRIARDGWQDRFAGLFHAAGSGEASWHGLAEAVFDAAAPLGLRRPRVAAIATADWPTPVRRPPDSRLDCSRLEQVFGLRLPPWQQSVAACVATILAAEPPVASG